MARSSLAWRHGRDEPVRIGVSACLLGEKVRYDGGHRWDRFITDTLGKHVTFVPVCPEVECGLSIPREPMRLCGDPASPRLVTTSTNRDYTLLMLKYARRRVTELGHEGLWGFIFKSGSPSSGMERVRVYNERGAVTKTGIGLFARTFMEHFPLLPVEDEVRLHDSRIRENFIEAMFVFKRWREVVAKKPSRDQLVEFHTRHKLLILSHSRRHYRLMEQLVADAAKILPTELRDRYQPLLIEAIRLNTTVKKNADTLLYAMSYLKKQISNDEKHELLEVIEDYRLGNVPLMGPRALINHCAKRYNQVCLKHQWYLNPHPAELQLRNYL